VALFGRVEEIVGPGDRVAQRLLTSGQIARPAGQQRQPLLQAGQEDVGGEMADPRRGQLDRQRQAVQTPTDLGDGGAVRLRQHEVEANGLGAVDEEAHRVALGQLRGWAGRVGEGQRRHGDDPLHGEAQRLAAGDQRPQPGTGRQQARDQRRRLDDLLEVVQDQEQRLVAQGCGQPLDDRAVPDLPHAQRLSNDRRDEGGIGQRRQVDEGDAISELTGKAHGNLEREAGLADPARTGQGDERHVVAPQQRAQLGQLACPADEWGPG
jgi:hypothetical protein